MLRSASVLLVASVCFLASHAALSQQAEPEAAQNKPTTLSPASIERQPIPDDAELGVVRRSIIIVDDTQRIASERLGSFIGQIDSFLSNTDADTDEDAVSNGSWARIRLDGIRANGEKFEFKPKVKIRAVLPRTERKLKLLISTDDDDESSAADVQVQAGAVQPNQSGSLALRFISSVRENSRVNVDVGVRQRDGDVQTFVKLKMRYELELGDKWTSRAANTYQNYSKSGFSNNLSFDFRRLIYNKDNLYFRTYTEFNWNRQQKGAAIGHTTGIYWQLGGPRALALEGLAGYNTSLNPGVSDRFSGHQFRIRWRDSMGRPWAFYEVWPSVAWPSSTRYEKTYGILLRAEFIIGQRDR